MTTEDDFQSALDINPDDHNARFVFADWLQERDDPRAEGYRALAWRRRDPAYPIEERRDWIWFNEAHASVGVLANTHLPPDWFALLTTGAEPGWDYRVHPEAWREYPTRRAAEDDAALAFSKLPAERRAELLAEKK